MSTHDEGETLLTGREGGRSHGDGGGDAQGRGDREMLMFTSRHTGIERGVERVRRREREKSSGHLV